MEPSVYARELEEEPEEDCCARSWPIYMEEKFFVSSY